MHDCSKIPWVSRLTNTFSLLRRSAPLFVIVVFASIDQSALKHEKPLGPRKPSVTTTCPSIMRGDLLEHSLSGADDDEDRLEEGPTEHHEQGEDEKPLARTETRAVCLLRSLVLLVLCAAAGTTTALVYKYVQDQEYDDFCQAFAYDASKVLDSYGTHARKRMEALESFSVSLTHTAVKREKKLNDRAHRNNNTTGYLQETTGTTSTSFPFVTEPDFARRASYTLESAEVLGAMWAPRVEAVELADWEAYAVENQDWLQDSIAFQVSEKQEGGDTDRFRGVVNQDVDVHVEAISPQVFRMDGNGNKVTSNTALSHYPSWQMAPASSAAEAINFDLYSDFYNQIDKVLDTKLPLLSQAVMIDDESMATMEWDNQPETSFKLLLKQFFHATDEMATFMPGPVSLLFIPVFDTWDTRTREIAGTFSVFVYWQRYLDCLLPNTDESAPLMAVLESTCHQVYSYEIMGSKATFLGYVSLWVLW